MVHAAFLFVAHEPKSFAMPAGADSSVVSITFTPAPQPKAAENTPTETPPVEQTVEPPPPPPPPPPVEPPPVKKVVKKAPVKKPKPVEKKPEVKKVTKKPPPKKQPPKPQPKKPEPKPAVEQKVVKKEQPKKQDVKEVKSPEATNSGIEKIPVLVQEPSFLSKPRQPKYPRIAQKRGIEGTAMIEVWLDENGKQVKQVLVSSSGATILDKSALKAIKKWKFSPHTVGGKSVAHRVKIPVRFKLD